ncbi:hypothetical protein AQUCO_00700285v1 [Aquilegia coerulea]|uniref:Uncharacterized protein n=1 Tax=Aquilegia coerulea TaxID=218851 RepID=A0A2G5EJD1_AQUCA|nr:hypothetical protein AQUCO_00700285v1 [Aquilegia coerulea]
MSRLVVKLQRRTQSQRLRMRNLSIVIAIERYDLQSVCIEMPDIKIFWDLTHSNPVLQGGCPWYSGL